MSGIDDPDYARFFTKARCTSWSHGYALCVHGSATRDLDVIAIPWTTSACDPGNLIRCIAGRNKLSFQHDEPTIKEHGRLVWTLILPDFDDPRWIDFSIMPPNKTGEDNND